MAGNPFMLRRISTSSVGTKARRNGWAAVEFAVCLPVVSLVLAGLWEVGRITEVEEVIWACTREAARDASLGQDNLPAIATNLLAGLQGGVAGRFAGASPDDL